MTFSTKNLSGHKNFLNPLSKKKDLFHRRCCLSLDPDEIEAESTKLKSGFGKRSPQNNEIRPVLKQKNLSQLLCR